MANAKQKQNFFIEILASENAENTSWSNKSSIDITQVQSEDRSADGVNLESLSDAKLDTQNQMQTTEDGHRDIAALLHAATQSLKAKHESSNPKSSDSGVSRKQEKATKTSLIRQENGIAKIDSRVYLQGQDEAISEVSHSTYTGNEDNSFIEQVLRDRLDFILS